MYSAGNLQKSKEDSNFDPSGALMDLSKPCNCTSHDFLIAKLDAQTFDKNISKYIYLHLKNKKHNNIFNEFDDIVYRKFYKAQ